MYYTYFRGKKTVQIWQREPVVLSANTRAEIEKKLYDSCVDTMYILPEIQNDGKGVSNSYFYDKCFSSFHKLKKTFIT